ncbi:maltoporin [Enterovibrio norvegicus FF-33]|uniref:Maltoporin n=3 Tax=Enterovibrio norvegicus TaxID=188144 RepID=A0A1E5C8P2_9GAMM|nr:carbohydrate porin [Enterovibrio norvegicus]OEE61860.1 maltoporin [Enterovibrio norvegicus FF-454]OEE66657.1 maltoporin [Enterovibrio norvegicus FF-33]
MKKSRLSMAVLSAAAALSGMPAANAAIIDEVEFHGYFRAGFFASKENDFKKADIGGQKELLGRLGLESDNDGNIGFTTITNIGDDQQLRINIGVGNTEFDELIGFVEMDGITRSGTLWGGKRKIGEENYIFMTDFFYTDLDGLGVGIQDYEVGDGFIDLAYISSDRNISLTGDYDDFVDAAYQTNNAGDIALNKEFIFNEADRQRIQSNQNNPMHTFHASYTLGALTVQGNYKYMPNNWDFTGKEWADTGYDATAIYHMLNFFGLEGNAFSYAIAQAGRGLGSGNLLGGTISDYGSLRPGSLTQGYHTGEWGDYFGDPYYLITHREEDALSARALLWGGYTNSSGIGFFPSIQAQYNDEGTNSTAGADNGGYNYWVSVMMRNIFPVRDNFIIQTEAGYYENTQNGGTWHQSKLTVAPTFVLSDGLSTAEIRFTATYLPLSWTTGDSTDPSVKLKDDIVFGIQADAYW